MCPSVLLGPSEVRSCDATISNSLHLGKSSLDHLERQKKTEFTSRQFYNFLLNFEKKTAAITVCAGERQHKLFVVRRDCGILTSPASAA